MKTKSPKPKSPHYTSPTRTCPCHSGKDYAACCRPYHLGQLPESALQLMRSRYCAYALNNPDYIIETTHKNNRDYSSKKTDWKHAISQFSTSSSFYDLKILDFAENGMHAEVTFTAGIVQGDHDISFTECSSFEKVDGAWLYVNGKLL